MRVAEMTEGVVYEAVDTYSRQGKIAYIHWRNVVGKVPYYHETFIDEGDVEMGRLLDILDDNGFDGVVVPGHAPQVSCAAPGQAGMAHTIGFIAAVLAIQSKRATKWPPEPAILSHAGKSPPKSEE